MLDWICPIVVGVGLGILAWHYICDRRECKAVSNPRSEHDSFCQAIDQGIILVRAADIRPRWVELAPKLHPVTMEFITDPIVYAISGLIEWMKQDPIFQTTPDHIRIWLLRDACEAKIIGLKGDFEISESLMRAGCESSELIYDLTFEQLWKELEE